MQHKPVVVAYIGNRITRGKSMVAYRRSSVHPRFPIQAWEYQCSINYMK
jgi:hypothetical protein